MFVYNKFPVEFPCWVDTDGARIVTVMAENGIKRFDSLQFTFLWLPLVYPQVTVVSATPQCFGPYIVL